MSDNNIPYFAIGPPMLSPTLSPAASPPLQSIRGSEDERVNGGGGGDFCLSEPPINELNELDMSSPPPLSQIKVSVSRQSQASSVEEDEDRESSHSSLVPDVEIDNAQSRFKVTNGLGSGGYSVVVLVEDSETLNPFAMKVIQKSRLTRKHDRKRIRNELKVLKDLKPSPFLEKCVSAFESKERIFFVMEFNSGGDLFFHLVRRVNTNNTGFKEREVRLLLAEVLLGLEHLHNHGYVHRDIKVCFCMFHVSRN